MGVVTEPDSWFRPARNVTWSHFVLSGQLGMTAEVISQILSETLVAQPDLAEEHIQRNCPTNGVLDKDLS